jgi:hypothetical protein
MEQCQSLKVLTLVDLDCLDEDHCRALGDYSRTGLEIELKSCTVMDTGVSALAEALRRNQGPTKIDYGNIDYCVLADGLRGNTRLKSFRPEITVHSNGMDRDTADRELLAIADALRENQGLVDLNLYSSSMTDETYSVVCNSLKAHPTLEVLGLESFGPMRPLVDMMKVNTSIHTIHPDHHFIGNDVYRESIHPYLETNRLRPRVCAIQKTLPIAYRAKVLGRALLAARTNTNSFWMLLSGNAEVAFPATPATVAVSLHTAAAAAAAAVASAAAAAASAAAATASAATASAAVASAAAVSASAAAAASAAVASVAAAAASAAVASAAAAADACSASAASASTAAAATASAAAAAASVAASATATDIAASATANIATSSAGQKRKA